MPRVVSKKRQKEARKFVRELVKELELFKVAHFGGNKINPKIWMSFNPRNRVSSAGLCPDSKYGIYLSLNRYFFQRNFIEYEHISDDKDIGSLCYKKPNWKKFISALVCHEYAHLMDMRGVVDTPKSFRAYDDEDISEEGHGREWQYMYRILRKNFVNKRYDD